MFLQLLVHYCLVVAEVASMCPVLQVAVEYVSCQHGFSLGPVVASCTGVMLVVSVPMDYVSVELCISEESTVAEFTRHRPFLGVLSARVELHFGECCAPEVALLAKVRLDCNVLALYVRPQLPRHHRPEVAETTGVRLILCVHTLHVNVNVAAARCGVRAQLASKRFLFGMFLLRVGIKTGDGGRSEVTETAGEWLVYQKFKRFWIPAPLFTPSSHAEASLDMS